MNSFLFVLAAGICGNAHLHEKLGSSEAASAVDRCLKGISHSIETGGGNVVQAGGGEVVATFDAADDMVHAAIEIQRRVVEIPPVSGVKMNIRAGISCGVVVRAGQSAEEGLAREAAHLAGLSKAGQILAVGRIRQALPEAMLSLLTDTASTLPGESGKKDTVVEIKPGTAPAGSLRRAPDAALSASGCLHLSYDKAVITLDEKKPVINLGRDSTCDVIIRDPRASRSHATISRRGNRIVLTDKSTNGTFVTLDGDSERFVKHAEFVLHGKGAIRFASSSAEPNAYADCARFECT